MVEICDCGTYISLITEEIAKRNGLKEIKCRNCGNLVPFSEE